MKNIFLKFLLIATPSIASMFPSHTMFGQSMCDSIDFHTDSIYINQLLEDSIEIRFDYDYAINPSVAYPSYKIVLDDTSQLVFRDEFLGTFLGQQSSILFAASYKNQNIPSSYQTGGTFDIHDPNSSPTLICQFPIFISFERPSSRSASSTPAEIIAHPNPAVDVISISNAANSAYSIMDVRGSVVLEGSLNSNTINVSNLPKGAYFIQIEGANQSKFMKF